MNNTHQHKQDLNDIGKGALINFSGVIAGVFTVGLFIFIGRSYGAAVVGLFIVSRSAVDIVSKLGILGFDRGIVARTAAHAAERDIQSVCHRIGQALLLGVVSAASIVLLMQLLLKPLIVDLFMRPDLLTPLRIMTPGIVLWTVSYILLAGTRALRKMQYHVLVRNVIEPVSLVLFAVIFELIGSGGVVYLAWAFILSLLTALFFSFYYFSKEFSLIMLFRNLFKREGRFEFYRFSVPIGFYDLLNLLMERVDLYAVYFFMGNAYAGVYSIAQNAAFIFKKVRQSFDPILLPVIAKNHTAKQNSHLQAHYRNVTRWVLLLNLLIIGIVYFLSDKIMALFGNEFTAGATALSLLTLSVVINTVLGVSELFILVDRPYINLINSILTVILMVVLNVVLVPVLGMTGAGLSIVIAYFFMNFLRVFEVHRFYDISPFTFYQLRILIGGGAALAVTAFVQYLCFPLTYSYTEFVNSLIPVSFYQIPHKGVMVQLLFALLFAVGYLAVLALFGLADEEKKIMKRLLKLK